jgi:Polysaccharide biosynthesis enzyme WcbI
MWPTVLDRRVIASLRSKSLRQPGAGPRIAVVANCQSFGLAYAMKLLNLDATVHRFPVLFKSWTSVRTLARTLKLYDYVFFQPFGPGYVRGGSSEPIVEELNDAILLPTLIFTGFHPDQVYVHDAAKAGPPINGPIGPYHSALAFFAYRAGLPVEAALRLFKREVFEIVGYFDVWNGATEALLDEGQRFALDFREDLLRWTRRGCFMYSSLHPKPFVFFDYARQLMRKAGIPMQMVNYDDYAVDDLVRGAVYPVYPEIAESYGIQGSYVFKGANFAFELRLGRFWNLREFVTDCYRTYAKYQADELTNERVQNWFEDAEISGFLRDVAGVERRGRSNHDAVARGRVGLAAEAGVG